MTRLLETVYNRMYAGCYLLNAPRQVAARDVRTENRRHITGYPVQVGENVGGFQHQRAAFGAAQLPERLAGGAGD